MRILALTGCRSDWDLLQPLLTAIEADPRHELVVVAAGAHLAAQSGGSGRRVEGFARVLLRPTLLDTDTPEGRLKSMGLELIALAQDLREVRPDLVLVLGDREDALLGAMAAAYSWIPVAHVFGGDSGFSTVDDAVRHAVSKLASLHFTASAASAANLVSMGEDPARVHTIGNPALDRIRTHEDWPEERLAERFGIDPRRPLLLVCQHPVSPDDAVYGEELATVLAACRGLGAQTVLNAPNSDPGRGGLARALAGQGDLPVLRNVEQEAWVALLKRAAVFVGNSSAGLLEAGFLGTPTVNVGPRQQGREQGGNVEFVPVEEAAIRVAVERALGDDAYRAQVAALPCPFGDGRTAERALAVLGTLDPASLLPKPHRFGRTAS